MIATSLVTFSCRVESTTHCYAKDSEEYAEIERVELSENSSIFSILLDTLLQDTLSKEGINNSELFYFRVSTNNTNDTIFCTRDKYDDIPIVYQILSNWFCVLYYKGYMFLLCKMGELEWFVPTNDIVKIYTSNTNILKPKYYKIPILHKTYVRKNNEFFLHRKYSFIDKDRKYKYYNKKYKAKEIQYCG